MRRALALALCLATPAAAFDAGPMTDEERAAFREEVRAYLLENPEVLVDAMTVLQERQDQAQAGADAALVAANRDAILDDGVSWVGGNPDGDITLVEFMDYKCGYCRRAFPEVEELLATDGNIRFVVKEFPILGEQSDLASRFAVAVLQVNGPEAYMDVHNALMTMEADVTPQALSRLAETFGLDPAPLLERMDSVEVAAVIDANHALAARLQITGTPTFVIGDQMVRGYVPLQSMQAIVADERGG